MTRPAVRGVVCLGAVYVLAGIAFGALAGHAGSHRMVVAWRWAAWLVSAVGFGGHIVYEQVRLRASPKLTALHVSSAVALGAFGLAVAANIHARSVTPQQHSPLLLLSLALWPILTALPAFLVALISALLVARVRRST